MITRETITEHTRNDYITFDEEKHQYWLGTPWDDEHRQLFGVTSWMSEYLPTFNAKKQAKASSKNPNSEWHGMEVDEILEKWNSKTEFGSAGHKAIEENINEGAYDDEWSMHIDAMWELLDEHGIKPLFAEWVIYDEDVDRASAIDICGEKDGKLVIIDMKFFDKGMMFTAYGNKMFSYPLDHLPASKYDKVSLQTSIYRGILERKYPDVPVHDEAFVLLYSNEGPELLPVLDYRDEVETLYKF